MSDELPGPRPGDRLLVAYFLAAGLLLLLVPWTRSWSEHPLLLEYPSWRPILTNAYLRGAVSGFGAFLILLGLHDLGRSEPPGGAGSS